MARPRKRKRSSSNKDHFDDGPPTKKERVDAKSDQKPASSQVQHSVLNQYYSEVLTLRNYVLSKLPVTSRLRRRKVTAVGIRNKSSNSTLSDIEHSLGALLDHTLVGIRDESHSPEENRLEDWKNFSQKGDESYVTLSNGVAGFVEIQALVRP